VDVRLQRRQCPAETGPSGNAVLVVYLCVCLFQRGGVLLCVPQSAIVILARADVSAMVGTSPTEIRKTYRHYIKEATDRLDSVQEQAWLAMGLDKDGNPIAA
jgi:hypothetical protein